MLSIKSLESDFATVLLILSITIKTQSHYHYSVQTIKPPCKDALEHILTS